MARSSVRGGDRSQLLLDAVELAWWSEGDRGLTVRRIVNGAGGQPSGLTSQTIYTYFGSVDAAVAVMVHRAVAGLSAASDGVTPLLWRSYAVEFPARWLMTVRGCGPQRVPADGLADAIGRLHQALGGPVVFAQLNGLIGAEIYGQLTTEQVTGSLVPTGPRARAKTGKGA